MQRPFLPLLETQWSQTWHFRQTPLASTADTGCGDPVFQKAQHSLEVLVNLSLIHI